MSLNSPTEAWLSELEVAPTSGSVRFPSGVDLRIVSGSIGRGADHWDPNDTGNPLLDTGSTSTQLSTNFTVGELARSGGKRFAVARIDPRLVECLQAIRDRVEKKVVVTSGYRSWSHNKAVYANRDQKPTLSRHCSGQAVDIKVADLTGMQIAKVALDVYGTGIGVGIASTYAHIDVRGQWKRWTYFGGERRRKVIAELDAYAHARRGSSTGPSGVADDRTARRASSANARYAERLGWRVHLPRIATLVGVVVTRPDDRLLPGGVRRWQRDAGLNDDGIIGPKTWSRMRASLGLPGAPTRRDSSATESPAPPKTTSGASSVRVRTGGYGGYRGLSTRRTRSYRFDHDWQDRVLAAVGTVEGGFDTVNAYDRGILSWGISQWSAHAGSLQRVLRTVKAVVGPARFATLFGGLNIDGDVFVYRGERYSGTARISLLFKGTTDPKRYDDVPTRAWIVRFALAGRDPAVQRAQRMQARQELDLRLDSDVGTRLARIKRRCETTSSSKLTTRYRQWCARLRNMGSDDIRTGYGRAGDYVGTNILGVTLYYGMVVNNPTWALLEFKRAIDEVARLNDWPTDPSRWPANGQAQMATGLERTLRGSRIATWGDSKAKASGRTSRTQRLVDGLGTAAR